MMMSSKPPPLTPTALVTTTAAEARHSPPSLGVSRRRRLWRCRTPSLLTILYIAGAWSMHHLVTEAFTTTPSGNGNGDVDADDNGEQQPAFESDQQEEDVVNQIQFCLRAGVNPAVVVMDTLPPPADIDEDRLEGNDHEKEIPAENARLGVVYAGSEPLPRGEIVGSYRALLVRSDVFDTWLDEGRVDRDAWTDFWVRYAVEFVSGEENEDDNKEFSDDEGENKNRGDGACIDDNDHDGKNAGAADDGSTRCSSDVERRKRQAQKRHTWLALPAGDIAASIDDPPEWWTYGKLSADDLAKAWEALNRRVLVNWRRLTLKHNDDDEGDDDDAQLMFFNAHLINEPPEGELENIAGIVGAGCSSFEGDDDDDGDIRWCGTALEAKTSRVVHPGEQFLWCYGPTYQRDYDVAKSCLMEKEDRMRE